METQWGPGYARVCDEAAVLPVGASADEHARCDRQSRAATIQIANGWLYARSDGHGLVSND